MKPRDHHAWVHSPCTYLWIDVILASDTLESFAKWRNAGISKTSQCPQYDTYGKAHTAKASGYFWQKNVWAKFRMMSSRPSVLQNRCVTSPALFIAKGSNSLLLSFFFCILALNSLANVISINVAVGRPKFFMTCQCLSRGPDSLLFFVSCHCLHCNSCAFQAFYGALSDLWPTIRRFEGM